MSKMAKSIPPAAIGRVKKWQSFRWRSSETAAKRFPASGSGRKRESKEPLHIRISSSIAHDSEKDHDQNIRNAVVIL